MASDESATTTAPRQSAPVDVESILASVPMLTGLRTQEIQTLANSAQVRNYAPDAYLMREGDEGDFFVIIVDGQVEVTTEADGHIATLVPGDYAGEQALIKSSRRNASLHAITLSKCVYISQAAFQSVLGRNTRVRFAKRDAKRNAVLTEVEFEDLKIEEEPEGQLEESEETFVLGAFMENFDMLSNGQAVGICKRLERCLISPEDDEGFLIRPGAKHPFVYLIMEGGVREVDSDGEIRGEYGRGQFLNEGALYTDEPVDFSVVISSDRLLCYRLERKAYQYEITRDARAELDEKLTFLREVDIFRPLLQNEMILLATALVKASYESGSTIFNQGDIGDRFYVIAEGRVEWSKSDGKSGILQRGQFFGERALRTSEPRAATIVVPTDITENDGSCKCFELSSTEFMELLGPVLDIIDDKIMSYVRANNDAARSSAIVLPLDQAPLVSLEECTPLENLETIGLLGKGGFGLVTLVIDPNTEEAYALKAIRKDNVVKNKHQKHIIGERQVMEMLNSTFLVNLRATYKDELRVYFLLDVCLGGELFTILRSYQYFDEHTARFYAACVIEAFAYMHSHDIIHRDLKPENLVLDTRGYAKLTDFGFAKHMPGMAGVTYTLCGTPDYLAPEIVTGKGHAKGVDWWTLGILIYEMLEGSPPFYAEQHIDTYRKIVKGKIHFPSYFSGAAKSLIRQLLHPKPTRRLGVIKGGASNIRQHSWFRGFHWRRFQEQKMRAPIVNKVANVRDLSNFRKAKMPVDDAEPVRASQDFDDEF